MHLTTPVSCAAFQIKHGEPADWRKCGPFKAEGHYLKWPIIRGMLSAAKLNCCLLTGEVMQCRFQAIWSSGMAFPPLQTEAVKKPGPDRRAASDLWALSSQLAGGVQNIFTQSAICRAHRRLFWNGVKLTPDHSWWPGLGFWTMVSTSLVYTQFIAQAQLSQRPHMIGCLFWGNHKDIRHYMIHTLPLTLM